MLYTQGQFLFWMQTVPNWVCFSRVASSGERSLPVITWVNNKMCFAYCMSEPATSRIYVRWNKQLEGSPVPWDRTSNRNLHVYKYIAHIHVNMKGLPMRAWRLLMHMQIARAYYWTICSCTYARTGKWHSPVQTKELEMCMEMTWKKSLTLHSGGKVLYVECFDEWEEN